MERYTYPLLAGERITAEMLTQINADIGQWLSEGLTIPEIAARIGVAPEHICYAPRRPKAVYPYPLAPNTVLTGDLLRRVLADITDWAGQGATYREIADRAGLSFGAVHGLLQLSRMTSRPGLPVHRGIQ